MPSTARKDIQIICPLSDGNKEYAEAVINKGKEIFGCNFKPLQEFIPFEQYLDIVSKIDVAIFKHDRQQAIG